MADGRDIFSPLEKLGTTNDYNEDLGILRSMRLAFALTRGYNLGHAQKLLNFLETIGVPEHSTCGTKVRLIRETASLIEAYEGPIRMSDHLTRPVYSPLMIQTDDCCVLRGLCHFMCVCCICFAGARYVAMDANLSEDKTVVERLLDLLHHPAQSLRNVVIDTLIKLATGDRTKKFSLIGERVIHEGRDLLRLPKPDFGPYPRSLCLLHLFCVVGQWYPDLLDHATDSGLVADMVSLLAAYIEMPVLGFRPQVSIDAIVLFLSAVVARSSYVQLRKLSDANGFEVIRRCSKREDLRYCLPYHFAEILFRDEDATTDEEEDLRQLCCDLSSSD
eukprot:Protomagalhaensia_sp_Gyna_25__391@NODE_1185_length_2087_cov_4_384766_g942_i0_p1_GENE_NODE_1185_length_2087_cov_4_384766_g942_i0NODE_1185_length_2087_cov_4_384766_g942_i0_p1_ORF_typecomplete_len332_score32_86CDC14/PF08045_11/76CDC14/PF08045_11/4_7_NODE_1185_length_2087_cov_4_384766_g942_i01241119